ncbi:MAG: hypothetical protein ACH34Y_01920 [Brachymonas sp.]|jgi:hypothetical protein
MNTRTPPAFIPTLTSELREGDVSGWQKAPLLVDVPLLDEEILPPEALQAWPGRAAPRSTIMLGEAVFAPAAPAMPPTAAPVGGVPRYEPVPPPTEARTTAKAPAAPISVAMPPPERRGIDDSGQQAEQMRVRLLQRVDVIVQRRVREAAAAIALEHAQNLLQELRPALEKAITESVNEALALELASRTGRS